VNIYEKESCWKIRNKILYRIKHNVNNRIINNAQENGFSAAWKQSYSSEKNILNASKFKEAIQTEIRKIKETPIANLYRNDIEKKAYEAVRYDIE